MFTVEMLRSDPQVCEDLVWACDVELCVPAEEDHWFILASNFPYRIFAHDASGGHFALCGEVEPKPVIFVSSEGQGGIIASHLQEAIQLVTTLPMWQDCLKFSGGGRLEEMQRVVPLALEEMREEEPNIEPICKRIMKALSLDPLPDPVGILHASVTVLSEQYKALGPDGEPLSPLFNNLVVENNPMWRKKLK